MRALGKWSIKNSVTVNLIMVFIIVAGVFTVVKMRRELFPQFALDMIYMSVAYPGSSICIKIEEKIEGIDGIDRITSTAREGFGEVLAELESGADAQKVLDEIKAEVDRIDTFPEESEEPLVIEILRRDPIISVAVFGDVGEKALRDLAEDIRDDLLTAEADPGKSSGGLQGFIEGIVKLLRFKQPDSITQIDLAFRKQPPSLWPFV
jgi:multidrug efflux pump subunit AcrB